MQQFDSDYYGPIVATGGEWLGDGVGSALFAILALLRDVKDEVHVLAYSITSASDELIEALSIALAKGRTVTMIVNQIEQQPGGVRGKLRTLADQYSHFRLYSYDASDSDMHAKAVVIDRRRALVGSSNLSRRGLHQNFELGTMLLGESAQVVAGLIERLTAVAAVRRWPAR